MQGTTQELSRTGTGVNRSHDWRKNLRCLKTVKMQSVRDTWGISAVHAILLSFGKWLRREVTAALLTILLWLFWKSHPGVASCTLFWLDVLWIVRTKLLFQNFGGLLIFLCVVLNAAVTEANSGVMPVVGMPQHFRTASPVWQAARASSHLLPLADNASLHFFSIGDLILIFGTALLFSGIVVSRLQNRQPARQR